MFLLKCVPFASTAVNAIETVGALTDGDGRRFFSKFLQTGVGVAMDTAFVMSGGLSSLVTAPLKGGAIEGGKIAGQKLLEQMLVEEAGKITTNVAVRAVTEIFLGDRNVGSTSSSTDTSSNTGSGSGGGNDPPRQYPKLPKEHEMDGVDYDSGIFFTIA